MYRFCLALGRPVRRPKLLAVILLLFGTTALVGCKEQQERAPTYPAQGSVRFDGRPTPGAFIVLHPKTPIEPPAPNPTGYVDANGQFVLHTYSANDGAPEGEYDVAIRWQKLVKKDGESSPGPNVLPPKYANPKKSNLTVQIAAGENQLSPIDLRR
jgi:hypothetical protein